MSFRVYDFVELRLEEVRSRFEEHQQSEIFQHLKVKFSLEKTRSPNPSTSPELLILQNLH